jgi:hypothetical protein
MTIRERVLAAFDRHKERLGADACWADLYHYDNDLGIGARWGDLRHAVKAEDFVPAGGLSDEQIEELVSRGVDQLAARRPAEAAR